MADTSVVTNPGSGGASWATATDASSFNHLKVLLELDSSGTPVVIGTANPLPANLAQLAGNAAKTGSGNGSSGSLSVYIATDQPSLSNAQPVLQSGTWSVNLGTLNGAALDTSVNGLLVAQGSTTSGEKGPLAQGAVTTAAPAYTTAQTSPLSLTTAGALRVDGSAVTQPISIAAALPSGTNTLGAVTQASGPWTVNATQVGGASLTLGSKTSANSVPVVIASDQGAVQALQSGTWTVQPGNTANTTAWLVTEVPTAGQGASVNSQLLTSSGVVAANIKGSAGTIYSIDITNNNSTPVFARLYDKATSPGTADTPIWRGIVPGNSGAAGMVRVFSQGLKTASGIGIRVTGAIADNDATNINNISANVEYA